MVFVRARLQPCQVALKTQWFEPLRDAGPLASASMRQVGSVDILEKRQRCLKRYKLKLKPSSRACRFCVRRERPGARAESLRLTEENKLSIRARRRYTRREKSRRISARTPWMRQVFFPRLAGIPLCAPSSRRM